MHRFGLSLVIALVLAGGGVASAQDPVIIYPATIDVPASYGCNGTWTTLANNYPIPQWAQNPLSGHTVSIVIEEQAQNGKTAFQSTGGITKEIKMSAPAGWEFNPAANPAPWVYIKTNADIKDVSGGYILTVTSSSVTFSFVVDANGNKQDIVFINNIQVRPKATPNNPPAANPYTSYYILRTTADPGSPEASIVGAEPENNPNVRHYGELRIHPGPVADAPDGLKFTVQPGVDLDANIATAPEAIEYTDIPGKTASYPQLKTVDCAGNPTTDGVPNPYYIRVRLNQQASNLGLLWGNATGNGGSNEEDISSGTLNLPGLTVQENLPNSGANNAVGLWNLKAYTITGPLRETVSDQFHVKHLVLDHLQGTDPICAGWDEGVQLNFLGVRAYDVKNHLLDANLHSTYSEPLINVDWDTGTYGAAAHGDDAASYFIPSAPSGYTSSGALTLSGINIYIDSLKRNIGNPAPMYFRASVAANPAINTGLVSNCSVLPVELTAFTAQYRNAEVHLKWTTGTEKNNYGFDVERSVDGKGWIVAGFVRGGGTRNTPSAYSYTDRLDDVTQRANVIQYRLRQMDRDGTFAYSPLVTVNVSGVATRMELFQNFPNPFNPSTNISFSLPTADVATLSVYNSAGEEIARMYDAVSLEAGTYTVPLLLHNRASGAYTYVLKTRSGIATRSMMLSK